MKKLSILLVVLSTSYAANSQIYGNINNERYQIAGPSQNFNVGMPSMAQNTISIKGIANIKPDALVAIYAVNQVGPTVEETNTLMDERIKRIELALSKNKSLKVYVDMISFVPLYEVQTEKKAFSKKTFNEVPAGFELKKNIHIQFKNGGEINEIMKVLSQEEIYDLVRVDYTINNVDSIKTEMVNKARNLMLARIKNYEILMGGDYSGWDKGLNEGFSMYLPTEMYRSYTAYQNTSLTKQYSATYKPSTQYYQPLQNKIFDFTINPSLMEPAVQIAYEIKWTAARKQVDKSKPTLIIGNTGEVKTLNL